MNWENNLITVIYVSMLKVTIGERDIFVVVIVIDYLRYISEVEITCILKENNVTFLFQRNWQKS